MNNFGEFVFKHPIITFLISGVVFGCIKDIVHDITGKDKYKLYLEACEKQGIEPLVYGYERTRTSYNKTDSVPDSENEE